MRGERYGNVHAYALTASRYCLSDFLPGIHQVAFRQT